MYYLKLSSGYISHVFNHSACQFHYLSKGICGLKQGKGSPSKGIYYSMVTSPSGSLTSWGFQEGLTDRLECATEPHQQAEWR